MAGFDDKKEPKPRKSSKFFDFDPVSQILTYTTLKKLLEMHHNYFLLLTKNCTSAENVSFT